MAGGAAAGGHWQEPPQNQKRVREQEGGEEEEDDPSLEDQGPENVRRQLTKLLEEERARAKVAEENAQRAEDRAQRAEAETARVQAEASEEKAKVEKGTSDWLKTSPREMARKPMQRLADHDRSTTPVSGTVSSTAVSEMPPTVTWGSFPSDVAEYVAGLSTDRTISQAQKGFASVAEQPQAGLETANCSALQSLYTLASAVLDAAAAPADLLASESLQYRCAPERCIARCDGVCLRVTLPDRRPVGKTVAVLEAKRRRALSDDIWEDMLAALQREGGPPANLMRMLVQLFGYMVRARNKLVSQLSIFISQYKYFA